LAKLHYILTPVGSAGDVHPHLGIGRELRRRGHEVTLVTGAPFGPAAERAGLRFAAIGTEEEFDSLTHHPDLWHPQRGMAVALGAVRETLRPVYSALSELYEPGRTILIGHPLALATRTFEEKHDAPAVTLHPAPVAFRSFHLTAGIPPARDISGWPRPFKRALFWLADRFFVDPHIGPALNAWRAELGLRPVSRVFDSWLHSPRAVIGLFPDWFGPPQPDWPPQVRTTGFPLFDDDAGHVDPELDDFLDAGEPPIVFTPGSANRQAPAFFAAAVGAARSLDRRALLLTQFPEQLPEELPTDVRHESWVPLSRILPRCAALVHHGGVGTCAQGLAAGIPQLTMPMGFDQPDNALRLGRLGVGAWVVPRQFTAPRVAKELGEMLLSEATAAACRKYAEAIAASDPVGQTCDLLEEVGGD
jgi:UDP:flavonoid glycosyltransferase YjiC (YdhE family)